MPAITPSSPLPAAGDMFARLGTKIASVSEARPLSYVTDTTEILDTDIEDESDYEPVSPKDSLESGDSRRRSQTTISSYDEAPTPSPRASVHRAHFELRFRPAVEGPKGPHLFRSSQISAEFDYDYALQMSPLFPKEQPLRTDTAFTEQTATPVASQLAPGFSLDNAVREPSSDLNDPMAIISSWSTQQVIDWMYDAGLDATVIECFAQHDINGAVLVDLQFEDLKELDIQSFGKRHQLWSAICVLTGEDGHISPANTPFQDISRPCTAPPGRSASRRRSSSHGPSVQSHTTEDVVPITPMVGKKARRGRKVPKTGDVVTPAESVSIVAIEQLLPKPHKCAKGERCAKWRKQQRELKQLQDEHGIGRFPISPTRGGRIFVAGDPGNATTAQNLVPNVYKQPEVPTPPEEDPFRPVSEAQPSVVASSDLLGPGQLPEFALHQDMLQCLGSRDPQDNVKQFLNFQHMQTPVPDEAPPTPPYEMFPAKSVAPFPAQQYHVQAQPQRFYTPGPQQQGRPQLPRLEIPRSLSAGPAMHTAAISPQTAGSICRSATASPGMNLLASPISNTVYRLGTPASEVDVPMTALPMDPIDSRITAQSVPPNMQYRPQQALARSHSRATHDWRRPSMQLPAVMEGEVLSASADDTSSKRPSLGSSNSAESGLARRKTIRDPAHHSPVEAKTFGYGPDCTHAGWMRKRKTKFLHHEWNDAHFRLKGTELSQHNNAKLNSTPTDIINVDNYSVTCSSVSSNNKLSAAMKALKIKEEKKDADPTAFAFQLIPTKASPEKKSIEKNGKTHHFAVKTANDRIDWMREVMLAKAKKQVSNGYEVEVNGQHV